MGVLEQYYRWASKYDQTQTLENVNFVALHLLAMLIKATLENLYLNNKSTDFILSIRKRREFLNID